MSPEEVQSLSVVLEVIKSGGVVAVLVVVTWAFYSGKLLSQPVYERLTKDIVESVVEQLLPTIQECLKPTVLEALDEYFGDEEAAP